MLDIFAAAQLRHVHRTPQPGRAVHDVLTKSAFEEAWSEITSWPGYSATPLVSLSGLARQIGLARLYFKDEGPRFGLGSFKALGAAYAALRLLRDEVERQRGHGITLTDVRRGAFKDECSRITLVSATDGNHGRSLAWGCQRFGAPCRIYIHAEVSPGREAAMRAFGAEVMRIDGDYDASVLLAQKEAAEHGWFVVSDTSWPGYTEPPRDVMAGYGVMTCETCAALDQPPTHVLLQGGVGGMAASVAAFLHQTYGARAPRVIVIESEYAACLFASGKAGRLTEVTIAEETMMAGLSCGTPSPLAWPILHETVSDFITLPDAIIPPAMRILARPPYGDPPIQAGECSAAGLAVILAALQTPDLAAELGLNRDARVLLFGTEGVTDPDIFAAIMADDG